MALPSPVAQLPDFTSMIQQTRGRANSMFQQSWSQMQGLGPRPEAPTGAEGAGQQIPEWRRPMDGSVGPQGSYAPNRPAPGGGTTGSDNYSAMGFADNVPRSLIGTESSGNFQAENNVEGAGGHKGHFGILQFGQARLQDAINAGAIGQMTPQQFKQDKRAQIAASNWHFSDIDSRIRKAGYDQFIGQQVGGAPITWDGMRAMAHLGGFGGLSKYMNSGGSYNPADDYGTSLKDYAITHSKGRI